MSRRPHYAIAAGMLGIPASNFSAPLSSSVITCSAFDDDPPGCPDCAASTAVNAIPAPDGKVGNFLLVDLRRAARAAGPSG